MATTWAKRPLRLYAPNDNFISLLERRIPEGASQTFVTHSPLKMASGLAVVYTAGADISHFSCEAGQNTSGATAKVYMAHPGLEFEANFLGASAADNVLAAADVGTGYDLASDANLLGTGVEGWYLQDSTSNVVARICELRSEHAEAQTASYPAAGDTNARVRCMPLISKLHWYD